MILLAIMAWVTIGIAVTIFLMPAPTITEFVYSSVLWPITIIGAIKYGIQDRPK